MKYEVKFWGSHPDDGNDDCWNGEEFETLEEAQACFESPPAYVVRDHSHRFAELSGPGYRAVRNLLTADEARAADLAEERYERQWRREIAMEEGMLGGCDAYNEVLGY